MDTKTISLVLGDIIFLEGGRVTMEKYQTPFRVAIILSVKQIIQCPSVDGAERIGETLISLGFTNDYLVPASFDGYIDNQSMVQVN